MGASTGNTKITSVIQFENVSKTFSIRNGASTHRVAALASVSLEIQAGEFVFLTGPSGAGKSTLIRLVLGLENVDQGEVFCIGQNLKTLSERKRRNLRQNVGIIFQDHKLIQSLNVRDNIHLPLSFTSISRKAARKRVDLSLIHI